MSGLSSKGEPPRLLGLPAQLSPDRPEIVDGSGPIAPELRGIQVARIDRTSPSIGSLKSRRRESRRSSIAG
jgi:hypothetical protein